MTFFSTVSHVPMLPVELEELLEKFESNWQPATQATLESLLAGVDAEYRGEFLAEVIMMDLELRLGAEQSIAQVDQHLLDCLSHFAELGEETRIRFKVISHWEAAVESRQASNGTNLTDPWVTSGHDVRSARTSRFSLPCQFGHFELQRVLGAGGMGTVYEAKQRSPRRTVAIKILHEDVANDRKSIRRFTREIDLAGQVLDPGVVPVYESGTIEGHNYYVMPVLCGGTLRQWIQRGLLAPSDYARIVRDLARAVSETHRCGIVHRDLKPENILFDQSGRPQIADFGLSKHADQSETITETGQICGTLGYLAPEKIVPSREDDDEKAGDIYSLGAILYDALCGRPPYRGRTMLETFSQAVTRPPVAPVQLNPAVDRDVETICLKCLNREPSRRYASSQELADDLDRYLAGQPIRARRPTIVERGRILAQRYPAWAAFSLIGPLLVFATLAAIVLLLENGHSRRELENEQRLRESTTMLARLSESNSRLLGRAIGWRSESLELLRRASEIDVSDRNEVGMRSQVATTALQYDIKPVATIAEGIWADVVEFDPTGKWLAVGQNKDHLGFSVWLYSLDDLAAEPYQLWIDTTIGNAVRYGNDTGRYEDGARTLAFSADGSELAIGTRHGRLHRYHWDGNQARHVATHDPVPGVEAMKLEYSPFDDSLWVLLKNWQLRAIRDGQVVLTEPIGESPLRSFAFSPTEPAVFATVDFHSIRRYDLDTNEQVWEVFPAVEGDFPADIAVSADGRLVGFSLYEQRVFELVEAQWGTRCLALPYERSLGRETPRDHELFHGDAFLLTSSSAYVVRVWDVVAGTSIGSFEVPERDGLPKISASKVTPRFAVAEHQKVTVYEVSGTDMIRCGPLNKSQLRDFEMDATEQRIAAMGINLTRKRNEKVSSHTVFPIQGNRPDFEYVAVETQFKRFGEELPVTWLKGTDQLATVIMEGFPVLMPISAQLDSNLATSDDSLQKWISCEHLELPDGQGCKIEDDERVPRGKVLKIDTQAVCQLKLRFKDSMPIRLQSYHRVGVYLVARADDLSIKRMRIKSRHKGTVIPWVAQPVADFQLIWLGFYPAQTIAKFDLNIEFDQPPQEMEIAGIWVQHDPLRFQVDDLEGENRQVEALAYHAPTDSIWATVNDEELRVWDAKTLDLQAKWLNRSTSFEAGIGTLKPMLVTNDYVVSGTIAGEIFVFDAESREMVVNATPQESDVCEMAAIDGGQQIAVGFENGSVYLLDLPSLVVRQKLKHHELAARAVDYDPTRQWLFVGSDDETIAIWKRTSGKFEKYLTINLMRGRVKKLSYIPSEDLIAVMFEAHNSLHFMGLDRLESLLTDYGLMDATVTSAGDSE